MSDATAGDSRLARGWWALPPLVLLLGAPLWLHWWEPAMFIAINAACAGVAAPLWTGLSMLGNGWGVLGVTAPLLVLAPRYLWAWLCAAPFAIVFARAGKEWIVSERPAAVIDNDTIRIVGEALYTVSMPSGHTLTAFAVASSLFFAVPAGRRRRFAWLWLLALGAGVSRIAVGAHWPGDVVVGAALGILAGLLGNLLLRRVSLRRLEPDSWSLRAVAVLVALAVYHLVGEQLDFSENAPLQTALAMLAVASLVMFAASNLQAMRRR